MRPDTQRAATRDGPHRSRLGTARHGGRVVVTDKQGVAIASSEGRTGENYLNRVEIKDALTGDASAGERPSESLGEPLGYAAVPVRVGKDVENVVLARAVRWHAEHRILLNGQRTVVFSQGT